MFAVFYGAKRRCRRCRCPVCKKPFLQLLTGTPKSCSQSCARKLEWKTGIHDYQKVETRHVSGYRLKRCYGHPRAHKNGWVLEHILVMERLLGRKLLPGEHVHHKNGKRNDNRPSNLELWRGRKDPPGHRWNDLVNLVLLKLEDFDEMQKAKVKAAFKAVLG